MQNAKCESRNAKCRSISRSWVLGRLRLAARSLFRCQGATSRGLMALTGTEGGFIVTTANVLLRAIRDATGRVMEAAACPNDAA